MHFNFKRLIIIGIFNYFLRKTIKDFDYQILNPSEDKYEEPLFICNSCTRVQVIKYHLNSCKRKTCLFCGNDLLNVKNHLTEDTTNITHRLLKI